MVNITPYFWRLTLYEIIQPLIKIASANMAAWSSLSDVSGYGPLWETMLRNNLKFSNECARGFFGMLDQSREIMKCQAETVARRTEQMAGHVVHAGMRSIAIATQARKLDRDRRIFRVALPGERRCEEGMDRRCLPLEAGGFDYHVVPPKAAKQASHDEVSGAHLGRR